jgi:hypothetical protein
MTILFIYYEKENEHPNTPEMISCVEMDESSEGHEIFGRAEVYQYPLNEEVSREDIEEFMFVAGNKDVVFRDYKQYLDLKVRLEKFTRFNDFQYLSELFRTLRFYNEEYDRFFKPAKSEFCKTSIFLGNRRASQLPFSIDEQGTVEYYINPRDSNACRLQDPDSNAFSYPWLSAVSNNTQDSAEAIFESFHTLLSGHILRDPTALFCSLGVQSLGLAWIEMQKRLEFQSRTLYVLEDRTEHLRPALLKEKYQFDWLVHVIDEDVLDSFFQHGGLYSPRFRAFADLPEPFYPNVYSFQNDPDLNRLVSLDDYIAADFIKAEDFKAFKTKVKAQNSRAVILCIDASVLLEQGVLFFRKTESGFRIGRFPRLSEGEKPVKESCSLAGTLIPRHLSEKFVFRIHRAG